MNPGEESREGGEGGEGGEGRVCNILTSVEVSVQTQPYSKPPNIRK